MRTKSPSMQSTTRSGTWPPAASVLCFWLPAVRRRRSEFDPFLSVVRWRSRRLRTSLKWLRATLVDRLLNQFVRPRQNRLWDVEAEFLSGFQINH